MNSKIYRLLPLCLLVLILVSLTNSDSVAQTNQVITTTVGPDLIMVADPDRDPGTAVAPPASFRASQTENTETDSNFQVAATGIYVSEWIGPWPSEAQTAFQYSVDIWNHLLQTNNAPIAIQASWEPLGSNILGGAFATIGLISSNWYAAGLLNADFGSDVFSDSPEIIAKFSSDFPNWYFGTDGNASGSDYDFASVVLHEIGHGLGFFGSMRVENRNGTWGYPASNNVIYPVIYDRYTVTSTNQPLLNVAQGSQLADELQSDNIYFSNTNANAANCGQRVKLYAPVVWEPGSSYAHVDDIFNNTSDALMTYSLALGEINHSPGPIALGMLKDIGWVLTDPPPVIDTIPGFLLPVNGVAPGDRVIDLLAYTSDAESADCQLSFAIVNTPDANAGVTLVDGRYISINPDMSSELNTTVTIQATDGSGQHSTESFPIVISSSIQNVYLPLTSKN